MLEVTIRRWDYKKPEMGLKGRVNLEDKTYVLQADDHLMKMEKNKVWMPSICAFLLASPYTAMRIYSETTKGAEDILWLAADWLLWFSIVFIIAWTLRILAIGRRIKALIPEPEKKKFIIVRYKIIS